MTLPRLYLNHLAEFDKLMALEFGRVYDGLPDDSWQGVSDHFGYLHDGQDGPIVGFGVHEFSSFDVDDPDVAEIWTEPRFEVPLIGLTSASAGEIILAAHRLLGDHSTINRELFSAAIDLQEGDPEQALGHWLACLEAGDSMAHFALGYTLYDLGRYREAYRHLRYYTHIAPGHPWNWCWLGKAAQAIGELVEARDAYERAISLSESLDETDAPALLAELESGQLVAETPAECSPQYLYDMGDHGPGRTDEVAVGERFEQALAFAAKTHRTQVRKGSNVPYIGHLLGVCSLVIEEGGGEDEAIAALLHDAAEDQGGETMLKEIRNRFGNHVADIVEACSDTFEQPKPDWWERKQAYLAHLENQPTPVLRVSLADKLFNARAILRDYLVVGEEVWGRFSAGREAQIWYYSALADSFSLRLPGRMSAELHEVVHELRRAASTVRYLLDRDGTLGRELPDGRTQVWWPAKDARRGEWHPYAMDVYHDCHYIRTAEAKRQWPDADYSGITDDRGQTD